MAKRQRLSDGIIQNLKVKTRTNIADPGLAWPLRPRHPKRR